MPRTRDPAAFSSSQSPRGFVPRGENKAPSHQRRRYAMEKYKVMSRFVAPPVEGGNTLTRLSTSLRSITKVRRYTLALKHERHQGRRRCQYCPPASLSFASSCRRRRPPASCASPLARTTTGQPCGREPRTELRAPPCAGSAEAGGRQHQPTPARAAGAAWGEESGGIRGARCGWTRVREAVPCCCTRNLD